MDDGDGGFGVGRGGSGEVVGEAVGGGPAGNHWGEGWTWARLSRREATSATGIKSEWATTKGHERAPETCLRKAVQYKLVQGTSYQNHQHPLFRKHSTAYTWH